MIKRDSYKDKGRTKPQNLGPTQRQLRAGELVRHALVDILREEDIHDEAMDGVSITVTEVRCSPDLRHATVFVEPLGAGVERVGLEPERIKPVIEALNRHAKFLRGVLGRSIEMKFTPDLKFIHDESFNEAERINALFRRAEIARDITRDPDSAPGKDE
jgi:ribosome-binding factor A